MHNKRTVIRLVSCIVIIVFMQGCTTVIDHSAYVKALLDASYKSEFAEYAALTGIPESDLRKSYNEFIDTVADELCASLGDDAPDDTRQKLRAVIEKAASAVSYEVLSAEKINSRQYDVEIKTRPIVNFVNAEKELEGFTAEFTEAIYSPEFMDKRPEEVYALYIEGLIGIIEKNAAVIEYGEEQSLKAPVIFDKDKKAWYVPDDWQKAIFNALISI